MERKSFTFKAMSAVTAVAVSLSVAMAAGMMTASAASVTGDPARISINSSNQFVVNNATQQIWMNGANTPWENWNDFGGSYDATWWDNHFAQLHANGVNSTRVWINCNNDQNAVTISNKGVVSGVSAKFWSDMDSFFAIAQKNHIYIMATLISFDAFQGSQARSWQAMIKSSATIDSFVNSFTVPFVQRYGSNPYLWSIDLCNEPDWIYENAACGNQPWMYISNYIARNAAAIHANSNVLVTVGMAMPKYASSTGGANVSNYISDSYLQSLDKDSNAHLDFYAMHYYDWMQPYWGDPFYMTPTAWGVDGSKPAIMSESAALGTAGNTLLSNYQAALQNGWQGVMPWTSNGVDGCGGFNDLIKATVPIAQNNPSLVFPS